MVFLFGVISVFQYGLVREVWNWGIDSAFTKDRLFFKFNLGLVSFNRVPYDVDVLCILNHLQLGGR